MRDLTGVNLIAASGSAYDNPPEDRHAAALLVCGNARDVDDARVILEHLGLVAPTGPSSNKINALAGIVCQHLVRRGDQRTRTQVAHGIGRNALDVQEALDLAVADGRVIVTEGPRRVPYYHASTEAID